MNETLTINWVKAVQTKTGKDKLDVSVTKLDKTTLDVTVWPGFPNYANLAPGQTIQAKIIAKDFKGRTYYSLEYSNPATGPTAPYNGQQIAKAQEVKGQQIAQAQGNKELGIKISSTIRMAVDTALNFMAVESIKDEGVFKSEVKRWRKFYWENWDAKETDFEPFSSDEPVVDYGDEYTQ